MTLAERDGDILYLAPPDQQDRTNQGQGYTLTELEAVFFDESYKQTHIDGRWVDVQNYINNTQNRLVEKISFEPVTQAFYFTVEYVDNQKSELDTVIQDVSSICEHFQVSNEMLDKLVKDHLWLSVGFLQQSLVNMQSLLPELVDFQQRLLVLQKINAELNIKSPEKLS